MGQILHKKNPVLENNSINISCICSYYLASPLSQIYSWVLQTVLPKKLSTAHVSSLITSLEVICMLLQFIVVCRHSSMDSFVSKGLQQHFKVESKSLTGTLLHIEFFSFSVIDLLSCHLVS